MKLKFRKFWPLLLAIPLLLAGGFVAWAETPLAPMPEALAALQSDAQVTVTQEADWVVFQPADRQPQVGVVLYPGGRVDYRAYAPYARALAAEGYLVALTPMPLNLAFTGYNKANDVIAAYPEITRWAVGGHSLGGAMAAHYAAANPGKVQGLFLWAAYPAGSDDLSAQPLKVVSIYGTRDGLATVEDVTLAAPLLPKDTLWVPVSGGNHGNFGWYGDQPGDNQAALGRAEQMALVVQSTAFMLAQLAP
ncbi:MAG: alpha/beta hydrolase [Chloroflexota bacterium]